MFYLIVKFILTNMGAKKKRKAKGIRKKPKTPSETETEEESPATKASQNLI